MTTRCPDCDRTACPWLHRNDADRSAYELTAALADCLDHLIDHTPILAGLIARILGSGKFIEERGIVAAVEVAAERVDDLRREGSGLLPAHICPPFASVERDGPDYLISTQYDHADYSEVGVLRIDTIERVRELGRYLASYEATTNHGPGAPR